MILLITFLGSGLALAIFYQIQTYWRDQIYLATVAGLPVHKSAKLASVEFVTYHSSQLGIEFDYPKNFQIQESNGTVYVFGQKEQIGIDKTGQPFYDQPVLSVSSDTSKKYADIQEYVNNNAGYSDPSLVSLWNLSSQDYENINGTEFYHYFWMHMAQGEDYWSVHNNALYSIKIGSDNTYKTLKEFKDYPALKQIINTFKFIDSASASWKTYKNDQYGFEMSYPSSWKVEDISEFGRGGPGGKGIVQFTIDGPTQAELAAGITDQATVEFDYMGDKDNLANKWTDYLSHYEDFTPFSAYGFHGSKKVEPGRDEINFYKESGKGYLIFGVWLRVYPIKTPNSFTIEKYFLPMLSSFKFTK